MNKRLTDIGYITMGNQPEEFAAYIKAKIAALAKIIQQTAATAN